MSLTPEKYAELRVKHLEMLQAVISRVAGQGATVKNYCITLVTAIGGFAVTLEKPNAALLGLLAITIFWLLDARYLFIERKFRDEFDEVRLGDWGIQPTFEIRPKGKIFCPYVCSLFSWSIFGFYGLMTLLLVFAYYIEVCYG